MRNAAEKSWADCTGRTSHVPHAALLVTLHHKIAEGTPLQTLRREFAITERTLYRYKRQLKASKTYLRAEWWLAQQARVTGMRERGCSWKDVYVRLAPPRDLFSSYANFQQFTVCEEQREIEDRNVMLK